MLHVGVSLNVFIGYKDKKNRLPFYAGIKNENKNGTRILTDLVDLKRILFQ